MKILLIIPVYNEELNIPLVLEDIRTYVPEVDALFVDDGSTDTTVEVARRLGATVARLPFNLGIGGAVQTGYKYAERNRYDIAVQFDGDNQHRADQVREILRPILAGEADFVVGSRFFDKGTYEAELSRLAGIRILSKIISFFVGQKITDPTSGFRAVNRQVIRFFAGYYPDDYPEPEALVLAHKVGFRITEVPVLMRKRMLGHSSITLFMGGYYMIKVLLAIMIDMIKKVPGR